MNPHHVDERDQALLAGCKCCLVGHEWVLSPDLVVTEDCLICLLGCGCWEIKLGDEIRVKHVQSKLGKHDWVSSDYDLQSSTSSVNSTDFQNGFPTPLLLLLSQL